MSNEYLNNKYLENIISRFQKAKKEKIKFDAMTAQPETISDHFENMEEFVIEKVKLEAEYNEVKDLLAAAFFKLCDNIARYKKFNGIDIDDAIQEGVMICFEKIDRFNPDMGKSFNYFTTITINSFRQMYRCACNHVELKKKYQDHLESQVSQSLKNNLKSSKSSQNNKNFTCNNDPY